MNILFTLCGRAGSKGFKNKNLKEMRGTPLVYYSLAAIKCFADRHAEDNILVALNTDSNPLKDMVLGQNRIPVTFVERKSELAGDTVPKVDVIKDTYHSLKDFLPDVVIDLDITSPLRSASDIERILQEYNKGGYDIVFSVVSARRSPYFNMVEKKEDGFYRKICLSNYTARQQAPRSFEMNASIYAYSPAFLEKEIDRTILDYNCGITEMPDYLVLDIDSEEDFEMMQYLHSYYCMKYPELKEVWNEAVKF